MKEEINMINNKPMRFWLAAFAVSSLAACNDNDSDAVVTAPPTSQTQPDAFTKQVQSDVQVSNDDNEPKEVDAVVLATSEDAEPVAVN
jgi:type IV pilus biogenesis protein CpaD/CtpE